MKKIVKPHKARKPSASTDVPSFARGKDQKYIHFVFEHVTQQMFIVSLLAIFIGSIVGILIAFRLYQKHFATRFGQIYE